MLGVSRAIAWQELRVLRHDPAPLAVLVVMPLVLAAFTVPVYRATLVATGVHDATGAEQAVPGMASLFGFFIVQFIGLSFFRDHGWGVWDRLRASQASTPAILLGKVSVAFVIMIFQQAVVFGLGAALFGIRVRGSVVTLVLTSVCLTACLLGLGLAVVSLCRSMQQLSVVVNIGSLLLAGVGGALLPLALLPGWVSAVGRFTPIYWAMRGFDSAILSGDGAGAGALPIGILLAETVLFGVVAVLRFRVDERKRGW